MRKILFGFLCLSSVTVSASGGGLECFYELFTKSHFNTPVITESFKLDLNKAQFVSTDHEVLKRTLRLKYNPATIDGIKNTHLNFSLTYDGAHMGAVVPKTNGVHIVSIGRDGSDLVGGFLNCNVEL